MYVCCHPEEQSGIATEQNQLRKPRSSVAVVDIGCLSALSTILSSLCVAGKEAQENCLATGGWEEPKQ